MKTFLRNIVMILYFLISLSILFAAMAFPFVLGLEKNPPYWMCWIIYPLAIVVMASQQQIINYFDKIKQNEKVKR